MFNHDKLEEIIEAYKLYFPKYWKAEKYKWEAAKRFQDKWNIKADNFAAMFAEATDRTSNLLANLNNYPRRMISLYAEQEPETVREMFRALYDESRNLKDRMIEFQDKAIELHSRLADEHAKNHYQSTNAISTYLWLRYPDKYFIYKYTEVRGFALEIESDFVPKKGGYFDAVVNSYALYNEISEILRSDESLSKMFEEHKNDRCYEDPNRITMTADLGFFASRFYEDYNTPPVMIVPETQGKEGNSDGLTVTPETSGGDGNGLSVDGDHHNQLYTMKDFLNEVYTDEDHFYVLKTLLLNKKNLILQGAPGVGKTFAAKRLAYALMGEKDDSRIEFIQFHQNYSYEDFVMGYKPKDDGFVLEEGIFYKFCKKASERSDKEFFFIIDEINRGNMSKIFGELLLLIEKDYRGTQATLAYNGQPFSVPDNLYIIGMMNTADRSLAMIDYALRRRFSFYEMEPGFHTEGFRAYQKSLNNETFDLLIEQVTALNREIYNDDALGSGFRIGHSYFCGQKECTEEWMKSVVYYDIVPMLQEYWFDDKKKVQFWENNLSGVFND